DFKAAVGESVVELTRPIREKTDELLKNRDYLEEIYRKNALRAGELAERTMVKLRKKIGFVAK
ncbi:MAG: tryptophan--tRNA ligase, partial [Clostridia bacterium]